MSMHIYYRCVIRMQIYVIHYSDDPIGMEGGNLRYTYIYVAAIIDRHWYSRSRIYVDTISIYTSIYLRFKFREWYSRNLLTIFFFLVKLVLLAGSQLKQKNMKKKKKEIVFLRNFKGINVYFDKNRSNSTYYSIPEIIVMNKRVDEATLYHEWGHHVQWKIWFPLMRTEWFMRARMNYICVLMGFIGVLWQLPLLSVPLFFRWILTLFVEFDASYRGYREAKRDRVLVKKTRLIYFFCTYFLVASIEILFIWFFPEIYNAIQALL